MLVSFTIDCQTWGETVHNRLCPFGSIRYAQCTYRYECSASALKDLVHQVAHMPSAFRIVVMNPFFIFHGNSIQKFFCFLSLKQMLTYVFLTFHIHLRTDFLAFKTCLVTCICSKVHGRILNNHFAVFCNATSN